MGTALLPSSPHGRLGGAWPHQGCPSLLLPSIRDAVGPFLGCPPPGSPRGGMLLEVLGDPG